MPPDGQIFRPPPSAVPQFETERPGAPPTVARARDERDAARRAFGLGPEARLEIGPPDPRDAWRTVTLDGEPQGRLRPHARMRFRRD